MKINTEKLDLVVDLILNQVVRESKDCNHFKECKECHECKGLEECNKHIEEEVSLDEEESVDEGIGSSMLQALKNLTPAARKAARIAKNKNMLKTARRVGGQLNAMGIKPA